jgi:hypothetical protein
MLLQAIVVGVLVAGCAFFSAWRLAPVRLRLRVLDALGELPLMASAAWRLRLRQRTLARLGSGCGGCAQAVRPHAVPPPRAARSDSSTPAAASPNRTPGALRR